MLLLSDILIQNPDLETFEDLKDALVILAKKGELFFSMDVKPPFFDTPSNWEDRLEAVFTSVR